MASTAHSKFSASASARLLACPGSYELGQHKSDIRVSTVFAAEGTLAHAIAEACIFSGADPVDTLGRTYIVDGFQFTVDEDYVEAVETYVGFVRSLRALGYIIALEARVSPMVWWSGLPDLVLPLFGTADVIAYHPASSHVVIADLKFGRGVGVEVQDNPQLLYYSAGAIHPHVINAIRKKHKLAPVGSSWVPSKVSSVVVQPRAAHPDGPVRWAEYTAADVIDWSRTTLYQGVSTAMQDNGQTLVPGEKQCRFCPAQPCKAQIEYSKTLARDMMLAVPPVNTPAASTSTAVAALPHTHLSDDLLAELLDRWQVLKSTGLRLEEIATDRAKAGSTIPNWKLIPKRPLRKWAGDEGKIVADLQAAGLKPDELLGLRSPARVQKAVGKKRYMSVVQPYVKRQSSGKNLVAVGDPRAREQARQTAQQAFGIKKPDPPPGS